MPFSLEEQLCLHGPETFEELCAQLVKRDFPDSYHVRGVGGDKGLDIIHGDLDADLRAIKHTDLRVWQVKCFRRGVGHSQRRQAEESLTRVLMHSPQFWTLCIPVNLDHASLVWFQSLKAGHPGITFDLWQADAIVRRLREDESLRRTYFLLPQPAISREDLDRILGRLDAFEDVRQLLDRARTALQHYPKDGTDFYNGVIADWRDIVQGFDAPREGFGALWRAALDCANPSGGRVPLVLVTGRSGEGKSTLLMRLAAELAGQECGLVLYHKSDTLALPAEQLCRLPPGQVPFVIIDKITRFDTDTLRAFFERIYRNSTRLVVISAAIRSVWEGLAPDLSNVAGVHPIALDHMTDEDIEALLDRLSADSLKAAEYLGALNGLSRDGQVALFREKSDRQLLVALLEAKQQRAFGAYVWTELEELGNRFGPAVQRACVYVSALYRFDLPMPRGLLQRMLPTVRLDAGVLQLTHGLLSEIVPRDGGIEVRHPVIAEVIFSRAAGSSAEQAGLYIEIIRSADVAVGEDRLLCHLFKAMRRYGHLDLASRLLRVARGEHAGSVPLLHMAAMDAKSRGEHDEARKLFEKASTLDSSNVRVWQAWAIMEKGLHRIDEARRIFAHAEGIGAADAATFQAWGVMEKELVDIPRARELFAKAIDRDPQGPYAWQAWALLEKEEKNIGSVDEELTARWLFREGLKAAGDCAPLFRAWAIMETEQGNIGTVGQEYTARGLYSRLSRVDHEELGGSLGLWAQLEGSQGAFADAERLYVRAAEVSRGPRYRGRNYVGAASMAGRQRKNKQQQAYLVAALNADESNAWAHGQLGRCYGFAKKWSEAERHLRRAMELDPGNEILREWNEKMRAARDRDLLTDLDFDSDVFDSDCD